jgi:serine/threonine-protein kinase RsbT
MALEKRSLGLSRNFDIVQARQFARQMARELGFSLTDQTRIATAVSEVARRTLKNQGDGQMALAAVITNAQKGLECTCLTRGWIDLNTESEEGVLGGIERLMDEFILEPKNGQVLIVMRKWLP